MKKINVTESFLPPIEEYNALLAKLWESKWLTNRGIFTCSLESKIQNFLESSSKPLIVNNGTIALQLSIKAIGIKGEVITTPFSYIATTSSILWENAEPVFVDINPQYLTIDEEKIEEAITDKTEAILAVHVYGNPCNVEKIESIAKKHNLKVIYDAAHCFGVKYKGKSIFDYGDISTCSFHATKLFHTGEGGAIFCNEKKLEKKIYYHHNFGHDGPEKFHGVGINAKISELNTAMGLAVLPYMDDIIENRKKTSLLYDSLLNWEELRKPKIREGTHYNYSYYPIIFETEEALLSAQKKLNNENIFPRRYFYPSLNLLSFANARDKKMKNSEFISSRILCLPLFYGISKEIIKKIQLKLK